MLLLRIASRGRWAADRVADDQQHLDDAVIDLKLKPREVGLSVFRVEGEEDSREVAVRFALTCRENPRHVDYLVFPSELAESLGLAVALVSREDLDPWLSQRHHEILGLTPELSRRLAATILAHVGRLVERVQKVDLMPLGKALCQRDSDLKKFLIGEW